MAQNLHVKLIRLVKLSNQNDHYIISITIKFLNIFIT